VRGSSVILPTVLFYALAFGVLANGAGLSALEATLLGLPTVPVLWRGRFPMEHSLQFDCPLGQEGYVVRVAGSFPYREFRRRVGKYVRAGHVATHGHWMRQQVVPNRLKE